jgi:hypothetical protein
MASHFSSSDEQQALAPASAAAAFRTAHGGTARAVELMFTNRFKDAEVYLRETVTDDPARASLLYGTPRFSTTRQRALIHWAPARFKKYADSFKHTSATLCVSRPSLLLLHTRHVILRRKHP